MHVEVDPVAHRIGQHLVVHVEEDALLHHLVPDLGDHRVARLEVGHRRQRLDLRVEFGVRVARAVEGAVAPFARVHEEVEDILAVEGRHAPAEQVEVGLPVLDQREVQRPRLRHQVHVDPDPAQHADQRLADRLVVDVAVVRAVQVDREAVGIAGLGHQRLRALVVGRAVGVHLLGPAVHEGRQRRGRGLRLAAHHHLPDRVAVERQRHRLAHLGLGEGVVVDIGRRQRSDVMS
jgi:hypothetical protein